MKQTFQLITFHSTTYAMYFEKVAKENRIKGRLIPLPKQISAGCGLAFSFEDKNDCINILEQYNIEYDQICEVIF